MKKKAIDYGYNWLKHCDDLLASNAFFILFLFSGVEGVMFREVSKARWKLKKGIDCGDFGIMKCDSK